MPRNTKVADVIRLVPCPKCGARVREHCHRPSGRNHSERVHDAIVAELKEEAVARGVPWPPPRSSAS